MYLTDTHHGQSLPFQQSAWVHSRTSLRVRSVFPADSSAVQCLSASSAQFLVCCLSLDLLAFKTMPWVQFARQVYLSRIFSPILFIFLQSFEEQGFYF